MYESLITFVPKENIKCDVMLKNYTTFGVGGPANYLIEISNTAEIKALVCFLKEKECPYLVIGHGSNLLISDKGYDGVVLYIGKKMSHITLNQNVITAQAGVSMSKLAIMARENSLQGAEFAFGIPGTVGGGIVMNAGAYGGEIKQIVKEVTVVDDKGEVIVLSKDEMKFAYRHSVIKEKPFIVVEVCFELEQGNQQEITQKMDEFTKSRKEKQPLEYKSAGSTFKRPEGNFAGKLIMEAGLLGFGVGDAFVSSKHGGFVINKGSASAKEIWELIDIVVEKVYENSGIKLEREVIYVGNMD